MTTEEAENSIESNEQVFRPRIIAFLCNWCSYAGADLAGTTRLQYSSDIHLIRVNCSSRLNPAVVIKSLLMGADGVLIAGCHPGDCHYKTGNLYTRRRYMMLKTVLRSIGFEPGRLRLEWVSASEAVKFQTVVNDFVREIKELGPNRIAG